MVKTSPTSPADRQNSSVLVGSGVLAGVGEPELDRLGLPGRPLGEHPALGEHKAFGAPSAWRCRLEEVLGRGGMGVVWRAVEERIGPAVVVRTLPSAYGDLRAQRRLAAEARALGRICDRHVVAVHDYGTDSDGAVFGVMELVAGRPGSRSAVTSSADAVRPSSGAAFGWCTDRGRGC
ncbi:hypothetical protein AB0442_41195 [Kitasatospora sp. NPDC085895]|uniref:hypothetical protein n=1 Tax=Kitasatospora sp. NPDC085895 TaxID=3155057 RepID=UPI003450737A